MKLFQFAVVFNPKSDGKHKNDKAEMLVEITSILAKDEKTAAVQAARAIPEAFIDRLDEVEIVVRPF